MPPGGALSPGWLRGWSPRVKRPTIQVLTVQCSQSPAQPSDAARSRWCNPAHLHELGMDWGGLLEQARDGRFGGDFEQAGLLGLIQRTLDADLALDLALVVFEQELKPHLDATDRPAVPLGVHAQGDGRARTQAAERQLDRVGGCVAPAVADGLVGGKRVVARA